MADHNGPVTLETHLTALRNCTLDYALDLASKIGLEFDSQLPKDWINALDTDADRTVCYRASLVCWAVTGFVPRRMQLQAILADQKRQHILVSAGTGSGKTLPMAINMLLDDPAQKWITLTLSPLKRLQMTQVAEFNDRYHVPTVVINEDTPRDHAWYSKWIWNSATRTRGKAMHAIVTTEQLDKSKSGHWPMIATLVRNLLFQKYIARFNVDEAHSIHTDGVPHYGALEAFRPAWGRLDQLRVVLPKSIRWSLFSATFPPHILETVKKKLLPSSYEHIHITSNRPNTVYAFYEVNNIEDTQNYDCFIASPFSINSQPRILIFVDNKKLGIRISQALSKSAPENRRRGPQKLVRHYHSFMSPRYLQQTYDDFTAATGSCRILVSTSSNAVGVDFPNVKIVCNAGVPSTGVDVLQRAGRAIRTGGEEALFILFYEPWLRSIPLTDYADGDECDPDRPPTVHGNAKAKSNRKDRAPYFIAKLIQDGTCIRHGFAEYLNDRSPDAVSFTAHLCCSGTHPPSGEHSSNWKNMLPGPLNHSPLEQLDPAEAAERRPRNRPTVERPYLEFYLNQWLEEAHMNDPFAPCRPPHLILSDRQRAALVKAPRSKIQSAGDVMTLLDETQEWADEWAEQIFQVVSDFNTNYKQFVKDQKELEKTTSTAAQQTGDIVMGDGEGLSSRPTAARSAPKRRTIKNSEQPEPKRSRKT